MKADLKWSVSFGTWWVRILSRQISTLEASSEKVNREMLVWIPTRNSKALYKLKGVCKILKVQLIMSPRPVQPILFSDRSNQVRRFLYHFLFFSSIPCFFLLNSHFPPSFPFWNSLNKKRSLFHNPPWCYCIYLSKNSWKDCLFVIRQLVQF